MLLKDVKRVTELDEKINALHKELVNLYALRSKYLGESPLPKSAPHPITANKVVDEKEQATYENLVQAWGKYGIEIPPYKKISKSLRKAHRTMDELIADRSELKDTLGIVLVPPAKLIGLERLPVLRSHQNFIQFRDYMHPSLHKRSQQIKWRVLVAHTATEALNLGTAEDILEEKLYMVCGYDMRGLGTQEYVALSLQEDTPLDTDTWTLLLKNYKQSEQLVPSVACMNGQYRFELDDIRGMFGEERFRPAVDIKI